MESVNESSLWEGWMLGRWWSGGLDVLMFRRDCKFKIRIFENSTVSVHKSGPAIYSVWCPGVNPHSLCMFCVLSKFSRGGVMSTTQQPGRIKAEGSCTRQGGRYCHFKVRCL